MSCSKLQSKHPRSESQAVSGTFFPAAAAICSWLRPILAPRISPHFTVIAQTPSYIHSTCSVAIMATMNWRTINVDLLDPESPANFDVSSLLPSVPSISASEVQTLSSQIKQLLRGGDSEGALRGALENAPYGGDAQAKVCKRPPAIEAAWFCRKRGRVQDGIGICWLCW